MEVNSSVGELADNANKMLTFIQNEVMPDYDNLVNTGNQYNDDANRIDTLMLQFADSATALKDTMHEMATLIHEISEKCKGIQIVEQTREQAEEYAKDLSAEEVYYDMLRKIVDAPTTLHMKCSVRMLVPIIDRKLKERGL